MGEVINIVPKIIERHIKKINHLLATEGAASAEEYFESLPTSMRLRINITMRKNYVKSNKNNTDPV